MKKLIVLLAAAFMMCVSAMGQTETDEAPRWYIGPTAGFKASFLHFSDIDKDYYPKSTALGSGVGGIFVQGEFGAERQYAIRPELLFMRRGGGLKHIGSNVIDYATEGIDDITYKLHSGYLDVRLPLIYNFGTTDWKLRPYVYVAPILGVSTGGSIGWHELKADKQVSGYDIDLNESNYTDTYFAGAVALGARYHFPLGGSVAFAGLEVMYEHGFTDTYSSKEKKGQAVNINPMFPVDACVQGTRKYRGMEVKLTFGIPFDVFGGRSQVVTEEPVVEEYDYEEIVAESDEKPCYTLNEIVDMMTRGVSVEGKTICAIDDDINFDFAKADIKPSSYDYLDRLAETLIRTNARIVVKGHTDNVGPENVNLKLSRERAENVTQYLKDKGVPASRLSTEYYGMSRPIAPNDTEAGRARNRRVEFEILNN